VVEDYDAGFDADPTDEDEKYADHAGIRIQAGKRQVRPQLRGALTEFAVALDRSIQRDRGGH
jgi:hypothetical protein